MFGYMIIAVIATILILLSFQEGLKYGEMSGKIKEKLNKRKIKRLKNMLGNLR